VSGACRRGVKGEETFTQIPHLAMKVEEPEWRQVTQRVLGRLNLTHAPYHVHANNWGDFKIIANVPVPDVLEVSYLRRDRGMFKPTTECFPTHLDRPCHPDRCDVGRPKNECHCLSHLRLAKNNGKGSPFAPNGFARHEAMNRLVHVNAVNWVQDIQGR
jgi:hypothetical protein